MTSYTTSKTSVDYTWLYWNDSTSSSVTTTSSSSDYVWSTWASSDVTTCDSSTSYVWNSWVVTGDTYVVASPERNIEEERAYQRQLEEQREENRKKYKEIEDKRKAAEEKAKQLLLDLIGEEQLTVYEKTGRVLVKGNKYDYVIPRDGFIKRIEKDKITDMCVHLKDRFSFPETDNVIAMMLAIKAEEKEVNKMANFHGSIKKADDYYETLEAAVGL
jgi:hypothetical protein